MHHFDDYVINTDSRLTGDSYSTVKQLETLGYNVISINPNRWQGMAISSSEEKSLFLLQQLGLGYCDNTLKQNSLGVVLGFENEQSLQYKLFQTRDFVSRFVYELAVLF